MDTLFEDERAEGGGSERQRDEEEEEVCAPT